MLLLLMMKSHPLLLLLPLNHPYPLDTGAEKWHVSLAESSGALAESSDTAVVHTTPVSAERGSNPYYYSNYSNTNGRCESDKENIRPALRRAQRLNKK